MLKINQCKNVWKKNTLKKISSVVFFFILTGIPFLFTETQAKFEKTENVGKIVANSMPKGVSLKWDDPSGFEEVMVVRNTNHIPSNSSDGEIVYKGKGKSFMDSNIKQGTTYYYAVIFVAKKKTYLKQISDSISNSKPIELFQKISTPTKAAVVSTSAGSQLFLFMGMFDSLKDFWFTFFRASQALLIFLGLRSKKKNSWGIVYDWETKEPLKNVILSLVNERKEKISSVVSDEAGRFGFLVEEGNYTLEVGKFKNYEYRSDLYNESDIYGNVYKGNLLSVEKEKLLKLNVPLFLTVLRKEATAVKRYKRLDFTKLKSSKITNLLIEASFWVGFTFILLSLFVSFSYLKLLLLGFYLIVFVVRFYLLRVMKEWGLVLSDENKNPVPFAVVRAFNSSDQGKEQVAVSVSNMKGGFYLLLSPDTYDVSIKGRTIDGKNFNKESVVNAERGLVNGIYYV